MIKKLTVLLLLTIICSVVDAHKFYTSLTQIEYNSKSKSAEVIMNLFTDDLEKALTRQLNHPVKSSDKDFQKNCFSYIDKKFQVTDSKNRLLKNNYVGLEFKRDMVSIYLEIKNPGDLNNLRLKQVSLMEVSDDQSNIVNVVSGNSRGSLIFKANDAGVKNINLKN
ncbi:MAG: DUF6702 family protein [Daejeonella sp.]